MGESPYRYEPIILAPGMGSGNCPVMQTILQQLSLSLALLSQLISQQAAPLPENYINSDGKLWAIVETFDATVTAYTSDPAETDTTPEISADGNHVFDGLIACPRRYSFGTYFLIRERVYRCGDRMALRFDSYFDIWMSEKQIALNFGKRKLTILQVIPILSPIKNDRYLAIKD